MAGRLEAALRPLKQGNVSYGVLQETNLTKGGPYALWSRVRLLGDGGGEKSLGGGCGGLEIVSGVAV